MHLRLLFKVQVQEYLFIAPTESPEYCQFNLTKEIIFPL